VPRCHESIVSRCHERIVSQCHERIVSAWTNFQNRSTCSQLCEYSRMRVFRQVWVWDLRTCTPVRRLIGSHLETLCASLSSAGVLSVLCCSVLQRLTRILRVKILYSSGSDLTVRSSDSATQHTASHYTATYYITLQHTRNTLQHGAVIDVRQCNTLQHTTLQHTAIHCNTLQHAATHCNTLQHTSTQCSDRCSDSSPLEHAQEMR